MPMDVASTGMKPGHALAPAEYFSFDQAAPAHPPKEKYSVK
jgi:hypothetical protein